MANSKYYNGNTHIHSCIENIKHIVRTVSVVSQIIYYNIEYSRLRIVSPFHADIHFNTYLYINLRWTHKGAMKKVTRRKI